MVFSVGWFFLFFVLKKLEVNKVYIFPKNHIEIQAKPFSFRKFNNLPYLTKTSNSLLWGGEEAHFN